MGCSISTETKLIIKIPSLIFCSVIIFFFLGVRRGHFFWFFLFNWGCIRSSFFFFLSFLFVGFINSSLFAFGSVTKCQSAVDALSAIRENKQGFDIVMTAVEMPNNDGLQLLAEIVNMNIDTPVICE